MEHISGQFPFRRPRRRSAAVVAAILANATEAEDGNDLLWRPDGEYTSDVLFDVIRSRNALSGPGNDGQRFAHL